MLYSVKIVAAILTVLMSAFCLSGCKSEAQIQEQQYTVSTQENAGYYDTRSTVNVSGKGVVVLDPDVAKVGFTVSARAETAPEAQQMNAELMDAVIAVIRAKGIAEEDMKTGGLRISEVYDYSKSTARIVGYDVYYGIDVTVRDMNVLGSMISEAVAAGATEVSGPDYTVEKNSEAYIEALKIAVEAANLKAQAVAQSLGGGIRLVPLPISVTENGGVSYTVKNDRNMKSMAVDEAAADASGLTEVSTVIPQVEITATVDAVYQIIK